MILYLERQLFVWDKPAGVETQDEMALKQLQEEINAREGRTGTPFIHPIHRLDQPTSGIVVFARSSKALSRLQASLRERNCEKRYLAWIEGEIKEEKRLVDKIAHASHHAKLDQEGKESSLNYKIVQKERDRTLLLITLETGRYHQIRLQLASRGHPIVGDVKYGAKKSNLSPGILLHHTYFSIPHPITQEKLEFRSEPPFTTSNLS